MFEKKRGGFPNLKPGSTAHWEHTAGRTDVLDVACDGSATDVKLKDRPPADGLIRSRRLSSASTCFNCCVGKKI